MKRISTAFILILSVVTGWFWHEDRSSSASPATDVALLDPSPSGQSPCNVSHGYRTAYTSQLTGESEKRKAANQKHLNAFLADGWEEVASSPHDPRVVGLDPELLADNEPLLRRQLESTRVDEELIENAAIIALEADEHRTRAAAINAIGHSSAPSRDAALMEVFDNLIDERERGQALGFLLPTGIESQGGRWLIEQLAAEDVPLSLKQQIPTKLVLSGLHGSRGKEDFVEPLLDAVPDQWRDAIVASLRMYNGK